MPTPTKLRSAASCLRFRCLRSCPSTDPHPELHEAARPCRVPCLPASAHDVRVVAFGRHGCHQRARIGCRRRLDLGRAALQLDQGADVARHGQADEVLARPGRRDRARGVRRRASGRWRGRWSSWIQCSVGAAPMRVSGFARRAESPCMPGFRAAAVMAACPSIHHGRQP